MTIQPPLPYKVSIVYSNNNIAKYYSIRLIPGGLQMLSVV